VPAVPQPTLLPGCLAPLRLRGSGFARRERVRVTITAIGSARPITKRVRAGRRGTFTVTSTGVEARQGFEARAVGRRGSRTSVSFAATSGG
jgi:hypothetical protein